MPKLTEFENISNLLGQVARSCPTAALKDSPPSPQARRRLRAALLHSTRPNLPLGVGGRILYPCPRLTCLPCLWASNTIN